MGCALPNLSAVPEILPSIAGLADGPTDSGSLKISSCLPAHAAVVSNIVMDQWLDQWQSPFLRCQDWITLAVESFWQAAEGTFLLKHMDSTPHLILDPARGLGCPDHSCFSLISCFLPLQMRLSQLWTGCPSSYSSASGQQHCGVLPYSRMTRVASLPSLTALLIDQWPWVSLMLWMCWQPEGSDLSLFCFHERPVSKLAAAARQVSARDCWWCWQKALSGQHSFLA